MFLSLDKVSPLISHVCCIFFGLLLSYYVSSNKGSNECFLPGKVLVAFPDKYLSEDTITPSPGKKVHFAKSQASKNSCLIKNASAVIVQNEPFVVAAFNINHANFVPDVLRLKSKERLSLVSESRMDSFHTCSDTQIKYGP